MVSTLLLLMASTTIAFGDDSPPADSSAADSSAADPAVSPDATSGDGDSGHPADKGTLGIGLVVGEPTGIAAKLYIKDDQAIQGAIGPAFIGGGIALHGEFVLHPWILQDRDSFVLPVYLGPGVRFVDYYGGRSGDSHFAAGALGVVGMLFDFKEVPLDVFVEIGGGAEYDFTDGWGPVLNVGAGVRYYP
jgi:hypothetical protein